MLRQPNPPTPFASGFDGKRLYASDVQRGAPPLLWLGKLEKIAEKFNRADARVFGVTLALRLLLLSLLPVAMDGDGLT
jgi:hypothetical protein